MAARSSSIGVEQDEWGYNEDNGPFAWHKQYPIARVGKRQSPINIQVVTDKTTTCCTSKCISYECLRQRMTQNLSLHEQSQNTGNIHKRSHNNHYNHHHRHHHHHHHQQQHRLRHHHDNGDNSSHNENDNFVQKYLDSTGNSPVEGSSSSEPSASTTTWTASSDQSSSSSAYPDTVYYMDNGATTNINNNNSNNNSNNNNNNNNNNESSCKNQQNQGVVNYYQTHKKIFLGYPRSLNNLHVTNTGHGWQVNVPPEIGHHTLLSGPPLGDRHYRLAQFHCHWGEDCDHGSEHLINGLGFAAELHFVHWNCTDFDSIEEASKNKYGLAVLGVLVQAIEGEQNRNKYLDKIIESMELICEPGSSSPIHDHFDIKKLFPANRWMYASYEGSLTTPPLSEVVDWVVFLNPIQCSTLQIESFRRLRCSRGKNSNLTKNCRPVQPVLDRAVNVWTHH